MAQTEQTKKIMTLDNLTYYDGKIKGYINGKYTEISADLTELKEVVGELQTDVSDVKSKALLIGDDIIFSAD